MDGFEKFYDKALRFLSYRPRSEKEVRDNLKKKSFGHGSGPSETTIELIIKKLKEQRFLDDKGFTRWWIEQRTLVRPTGRHLIKVELKKKGVDKELIDEIFNEIEDVVVNELELARKLVQRKIEKYRGMDRQRIYQKLGGFLSRRGFDYDTIKNAIDEFISKEEESPQS